MKTRSFSHGAAALALVGLFACDTGPSAVGGDTDDDVGSSGTEEPEPTPDDTAPADEDEDDGADDSGLPVDPVCGDGLLDDGEECDGEDFGGRTCGSEGAEGGTLRCTDDCRIDTCDCEWDGVSSGCEPAVCGNGIQESGESCDGSDIPSWDFHPCEEVWPGGYGSVSCTDDCSLDLSGCMGCGDGFVDPDYEACDGPPVNESGDPLRCAEEFDAPFDGLMGCTDYCELTDDECVPLCGNGQLDEGEECDGDTTELTCEDFGAVGGELSCNSSCRVTLSGCHMCGNGTIEDDEDCDGEDLEGNTCSDLVVGGEGSLGCSQTCEFDLSACEAAAGSAVISEVMIVALPDPLYSFGEWIELYNPHPTEAFSLDGCSLRGIGAFETAAFDPELSVPAGGYLTLGEGTHEDLGFVPDGVLAPQSSFFNEGDTIRVVCAGIVVDEIEYEDTKPWPVPTAGVSIVLGSDTLNSADNDDGEAWCAATSSYADGYFGTPGGPGGCEP